MSNPLSYIIYNIYTKYVDDDDDDDDDEREKSDQRDGSGRSYKWRDIMKAVTFYFQNLQPNLCLYRFVLAFLPFIMDLTFGKILTI